MLTAPSSRTMGGFIGVLQLDGSPIDDDTLRGLRVVLRSRGSETAPITQVGEFALAQWGSLQKPAAVWRPVQNATATIHLALEGTIFNAGDLAADLKSRGHTLESGSAAEALGHLYEEYGRNSVRHLNGQFSFILWDTKRRKLFGARDHTGLKPFFFHLDGNRLVCASEIRALLEMPGIRRTPDYEGLAGHFFSGAPLADRTLYAGIKQLLPGYALEVREGDVHTSAFWEIAYQYRFDRSDAEVVAEVTELLIDAIKIRCQGDTPIGSHLSGGLDSSAIAGWAAREVDPLKTFSIRFAEGDAYDETYYAKLVAAQIGAKYLEATPSADDLAFYWPALIWHLEMPIPNAGGFSYFMASQLATKHVGVALTGHGGDEVFGGYPAQFLVGFGSAPGFAATVAGPAYSISMSTRVRRLLKIHGLLDRLRARRTKSASTEAEVEWTRLHCGRNPSQDPLLSKKFVRALNGYTPLDDYLSAFRLAPTDHLFDRCLYHDLRCYLPGLLRQNERVSHALSLESRAPILDHRVIEFMATVPPEQKVRGLVPKWLLRRAASWLPEEVRERRDKRGFPVPTQEWLSRELAPWTRSILLSPSCLDRGMLDPDEIRRGDLSPDEAWMAVNLELWFRIFIDQDPAWCSQTNRIEGRHVAAAQ